MLKRQILLWMILLAFICFTFVLLSLNVAIVSMVRPSQKTSKETYVKKVIMCPNTTLYWSLSNSEDNVEVDVNLDAVYDWNDYEKRMILSSFHWLTWISILPGSVLAHKFGAKAATRYSLGFACVMSSLIPFVARYGPKLVMLVRMMQGFLEYIVLPGGVMTIIGNWSTKEDRGMFVSVISVGTSLALGVGSYLFGYIAKYQHWSYIFHLTSVCGIVWTILWYFLIHDLPDKHPTISMKEKTKILESMKHTVTHEKIPIPWKDIFKTVPLYASILIVGALTCNFFMLLTFMPVYLNDIYGLDSNQSGVIVSLPQFVCGGTAFAFGWFTDYFIKQRWMSITNTRKLFSFVGGIVISVPLIIVAFTDCDINIVIASFIVCTISRNICMFGLEPALIDLSPKFCGVLHGIIMTATEVMNLAFLTGISYLTKLLPSEMYWKVVFLFTAAIGIVTSFIFTIWGSAETQSWNQGSEKYRKQRINGEYDASKPVI